MSFRADFKFCGTFSGKDSAAAKWLRKLDWELEGYAVNGTVPPHRVTQALDLLLTEEAATWAETHPTASGVLADANPTAEAVQGLRALLCERFPSKSMEVSTLSFDLELSDLKQLDEDFRSKSMEVSTLSFDRERSDLKQLDESLAAYYKRVTFMIARVGARDQPTAAGATPLSLLETAMLDTIMRAFLKGLSDPDVRREATRGLAAHDRSLRGLYTLAEQARRVKAEVSKLDEDEYKTREVEVLRSLVYNTMSRSQIDNLVTSYTRHARSSEALTYPGVYSDERLPTRRP